MQRAFIFAGVVDIELLTDNAIMGVLFNQSRKNKIKYLITGMNITEFTLYLLHGDIQIRCKKHKVGHKKFGKSKIKIFPYAGIRQRIRRSTPGGLKDLDFLISLIIQK